MLIYYLFGSYIGLFKNGAGNYYASGKTRDEVINKLSILAGVE